MGKYCDYLDDKVVRKRFRVGLGILSKKRPKWYKKIKLEKFEVQDPENCVLAQVYGNFLKGVKALNVAGWAQHGFAGSYFTPLWVAEVKRLRRLDKQAA